MQNFISNSCLSHDILDQINELIDLGYRSYFDLDRDQQLTIIESYLDSKGINIFDIQSDLGIEFIFDRDTSINNIIDQLFKPVSVAYGQSINYLFMSAVSDREHPLDQWADYQPNY